LAYDRAGVLLRTFSKLDQRCADLHEITLATEQASDTAALRRRHLDNGLVRLDRHERLVDDNVIALIHVPRDDLGLFQAFTEVRQVELAHVNFRSAELTCFAYRSGDAGNRGHVMMLEAGRWEVRII